MSNVVKAIMAVDTGERSIKPERSKLFTDMFSMKEDIADVHDSYGILKKYRIGVTVGNQCVVTEESAIKDPHALHHAIQRTKEQVIEAIFGEFRQDFRIIERHLYEYEFEQAATALRAMEMKMYTTE